MWAQTSKKAVSTLSAFSTRVPAARASAGRGGIGAGFEKSRPAAERFFEPCARFAAGA